MKSEIVIKPHLIYLEYGNEFAILQKDPNDEGLQAVTFSHEISALDADIIEKTGIANVESFRSDGVLLFIRKPYYETHIMCEIIIDILKRHEPKQD